MRISSVKGETLMDLNLLKNIHCWLNKRNNVEIIAIIFTSITIINSYMMVVGLDQPKEGVFAYIHLLSRLTIIIVITGIWEYKVVVNRIRTWIIRKKDSDSFRKREVFGKPVKIVSRSYVSSISICFTVLVISTSIVNIIFQSVILPEGGKELYQNLILLFGVILLGMVAISWNKLLGVK